MKIFMTLFTLLLLNATFAHAIEKHGGPFSTRKFCSATSINSCAHAHFDDYPTTAAASDFVVHVIPANADNIIKEIKVSLWMDMGNGSGHDAGALEVAASTEDNHFDVKNANFSMKGDWKLVITFIDEGAEQKVIIPIQIKE
ncbi:MAG: hypothetical protein ACXVLQ_18650 [Bacteriovorax sp.]